jgi:myo-inositol catabolism protein IolS
MNMLEKIQLNDNIGQRITRLGMGCWAIGGHGWGYVDDDDSVKSIRFALNNGINFFDTADVYGLGKSERILCKSLGESRKKVIIASKGGVRWDISGRTYKDMSPSYLRQAVEGSLKRLELECIPLYYIHWPDNKTPISDAVGTLGLLKKEGKIGAIGVSNFSLEQLEEAIRTERIHVIQMQYNILQKKNILDFIPICKSNNIRLVAWGALADGLLTGKFRTETQFNNDDHRSRSPEFQGEKYVQNLQIIENLKIISSLRGVTLSQMALRWVFDSLDFSCALFGAKTEKQVSENLGANGWQLTKKELSEIEDALCINISNDRR